MPFKLDDALASKNQSAYNVSPNYTQSINPIGDTFQERIKLEKKQDETIVSADDTKAFFSNMFQDNNIIASGVNKFREYALDSRFEDDKTFMDNYDENMKLKDLASAGLNPSTDFLRLNDAKSEWHRLAIIKELKNKAEIRKFNNEHLSSNTQMTSQIIGTLADIDTALVGPLSMYIKGGKLTKVIGASVALEAGGVVAKTALSDDYDIVDQGMSDLVIGSFANTAIAQYVQMGKYADNIKAAPKSEEPFLQLEYKPIANYSVNQLEGETMLYKGWGVTNDIDAKTYYESIKRNIGNAEAEEFMIGYNKGKESRNIQAMADESAARVQDRLNEIAKLEQSALVSRGVNKGTPKKMTVTEKEELNAKIQNLKNENELENTISMEAKLDKIKANELEMKYGGKTLDDNLYQEWLRNAQSRVDKEADLVKKQKIQEEELTILKKQAEEYRANLAKKQADELEQARIKQLERTTARETFTAKLKENSTGLKFFYKQQDFLIKEASKEVDALKAQKKIDEIREFEDLVHSLGNTVEKALSRLGRRLENKTIDINDAGKAIEILKSKFPNDYKAFKSIEKYLLKHRNMDVTKGGKILNEIVGQFKGLNKLQKAGLISFLLFAPSVLSASEGDDGVSFETGLWATIAGLIALRLGAPYVFNGLKNNGFKNTASEIAKDISKNASTSYYNISGKGKGFSKMLGTLHRAMSTGFNSSYKGLISKIDKKIKDPNANTFAKDLVRKLLFNPSDGSVMTFDSVKRQAVKDALYESDVWYKQEYNNFAITQRNTFIGRALDEVELQEMFNNKIADMLDGVIPVEKGFEKVVDATKKMFIRGLDDAVEAGVLGAKEARKRVGKNYFPRIWKFTELQNILNLVRKEDRLAMINGLAKGMGGSDPQAKAELLLDWIQQSDFTRKMKNTDNTLGEIEEFLAKNDIELLRDDAKLFELKKILAKDSEKSGRLQDRIEIDWAKVDFPEVDIGGNKTKLSINDFVNRDVRDVSAMYANDLYSKVYLSKMGYTSPYDLRKAIDENIFNPEIKQELNVAIDILLNKPLHDELTAMQEIVEIAKGLTFLVAMPFVAFSMVVEISKTIANAGLANSLKAMKHQIGKLDKNSLEFKLLEDTGGLGTSSVRTRYDFRGIEQQAADDVAGWAITRGIKKAQQMLAKGSGLIDISDITQKANYLVHATEFARLAKGQKNKLMPRRLESYGIDEKTIEMFKDKFEFNSNGDLLAFNKRDWTLDERSKFNDVMLRLNQEITPEVMVGTQGLWQRTPLGKLTSFLLSYPINLYENQAVKDFNYMDMRTLSNTVLTFGGSYMGMVAKYEALGREYDEEDLVMYSLLNLPSAAVFSAARSVLDPAITSQASNFKHDIETLAMSINK